MTPTKRRKPRDNPFKLKPSCDLALEFSRRFLSSLPSEMCSKAASQLSSGSHSEYLSLPLSSSWDISTFAFDFQSRALLRKYPNLKVQVDRQKEALSSFVACEERCRAVNQRLETERLGKSETGEVFRLARLKIGSLLEEGPPALCDLMLRFGPGATVDVRGDVSSYKKLTSRPSVTFQLKHALPELKTALPGWGEALHEVQLVHGSALTFVPKDANTDRPICIEPTVNSMVQRGYGLHLARLLRRVGVDVTNQNRNRQAAQEALFRGYATVDMKSASDLIPWKVVLELLPLPWVEALDSCRSHYYLHDGQWNLFEKFSSMGNGFTFELESLIFWAIARSCCDVLGLTGPVYVYGDDVILPDDSLRLFRDSVEEAGFIVNEDKTYSGFVPFRESCGGNYFLGDDVTPIRIKERIASVLDIYKLHNAVVRWQSRLEEAGVFTHLKPLKEWLRSLVPKKYRRFGPEGYGDGYFVCTFDEACPASRVKPPRGWCGFVVRYLRESSVIARKTSWPMAYALYECAYGALEPLDDAKAALRASENQPSAGYSLRGRTRIQEGQLIVRDWTTLGLGFST